MIFEKKLKLSLESLGKTRKFWKKKFRFLTISGPFLGFFGFALFRPCYLLFVMGSQEIFKSLDFYWKSKVVPLSYSGKFLNTGHFWRCFLSPLLPLLRYTLNFMPRKSSLNTWFLQNIWSHNSKLFLGNVTLHFSWILKIHRPDISLRQEKRKTVIFNGLVVLIWIKLAQ